MRQSKKLRRKNPQPIPAYQPRCHHRNHQPRLSTVVFVPHKHNQAPYTHIYCKVPSYQERHCHCHWQRNPPAYFLRYNISKQVGYYCK
ncbi:hypothetical protein LINPERHAP2_LOCUS35982 [Linum perenne]